MAASVKVIWAATLLLDETVASGLTAVIDKVIRHDFAGVANLPPLKGEINANTSPAITKGFSGVIAIPAGATFTIDLTALAGPSSTTVDFAGLKVQMVLLAALTTNVSQVSIKLKDGTTGYNLFGLNNTSSEIITLSPGQIGFFQLNSKTEDVDATHKDVLFVGTNGDAVAAIMVAG